MRKAFAITLTALILLSAAIPAFAAELPKESRDFSVVYTNNCDGITVPVADQKASGQLPDGTEFAAENLPVGAVTLRVYPVQPDEKDVKEWVEDSLAKEMDAIITYYVACIDADGNEISNSGAKVAIKAPDTNEAVTVYSLDATGKVQPLTAVEKDGKITFTATGAQLYPFAVTAKNPSTADSAPAIFLLLSAAALGAGILIGVKAKKANR